MILNYVNCTGARCLFVDYLSNSKKNFQALPIVNIFPICQNKSIHPCPEQGVTMYHLKIEKVTPNISSRRRGVFSGCDRFFNLKVRRQLKKFARILSYSQISFFVHSSSLNFLKVIKYGTCHSQIPMM